MEKKVIPFSLRSISTEEFATIKNCYKEEESVGLETNYGYGLNIEEQSIGVKFSVTFKCADNPFIILKLLCEFEIDPETFSNFKKGDKYILPKGFLTHMTVLTIGTARGVLHAKLEKTGFEKFILPTLDISNMIEEDMSFDSPEKPK